MRAWMVRYLSGEAEYYRLFQEQEEALAFLENPGGSCVPLDPEPQTVTPEEFLSYTLRLKMPLF